MEAKRRATVSSGPMLNFYPDSMGGTVRDTVRFLCSQEVNGSFDSAYILPSLFNTDLDRGFSVIDYSLNTLYVNQEDLDDLKRAGIKLKLDFILNHASVLSPQFQDLLKNGDTSRYRDFFIDWNRFWDGYGTMTEDGYIQPDEEKIKPMLFRKPGLPILQVRFPDGRSVPYWNTFYQEVRYLRLDAQDIMRVTGLQYASAAILAEDINRALDAGQKPNQIEFGRFIDARTDIVDLLESNGKYLGQLDLNIQSPEVWKFYEQTLQTLAGYGAEIVRLDAFAYAPKSPGKRNFLNEPDTWEFLDEINTLAAQYQLALLPEIHASYAEKTYKVLSDKGYLCYDFFLPGLILDAIEQQDGSYLAVWAEEQVQHKIRAVNMLGCHDGIPLLDLKGLLPENRIQHLIETVVERGGMVKDLHGQKNIYYQVNASYFSALGEDEQKLLLARALQIFMPGKPQVWYLDLFAGRNDIEAVRRGGSGGHKEINRTNLTVESVREKTSCRIVKDQLALLRLRNTCPAFGFNSALTIAQPSAYQLTLKWENNNCEAVLSANLEDLSFQIEITDNGKYSLFKR